MVWVFYFLLSLIGYFQKGIRTVDWDVSSFMSICNLFALRLLARAFPGMIMMIVTRAEHFAYYYSSFGLRLTRYSPEYCPVKFFVTLLTSLFAFPLQVSTLGLYLFLSFYTGFFHHFWFFHFFSISLLYFPATHAYFGSSAPVTVLFSALLLYLLALQTYYCFHFLLPVRVPQIILVCLSVSLHLILFSNTLIKRTRTIMFRASLLCPAMPASVDISQVSLSGYCCRCCEQEFEALRVRGLSGRFGARYGQR